MAHTAIFAWLTITTRTFVDSQFRSILSRKVMASTGRAKSGSDFVLIRLILFQTSSCTGQGAWGLIQHCHVLSCICSKRKRSSSRGGRGAERLQWSLLAERRVFHRWSKQTLSPYPHSASLAMYTSRTASISSGTIAT